MLLLLLLTQNDFEFGTNVRVKNYSLIYLLHVSEGGH
jgi:hypothetical protein